MENTGLQSILKNYYKGSAILNQTDIIRTIATDGLFFGHIIPIAKLFKNDKWVFRSYKQWYIEYTFYASNRVMLVLDDDTIFLLIEEPLFGQAKQHWEKVRIYRQQLFFQFGVRILQMNSVSKLVLESNITKANKDDYSYDQI